jgi:hypothetical protein
MCTLCVYVVNPHTPSSSVSAPAVRHRLPGTTDRVASVPVAC